MTTNYHTALVDASMYFKAASLNPGPSDLDAAITFLRDVLPLTSDTAVTVDCSLAKKRSITLGHNVAFTFSIGINGESCILFIKQNAASAKTPTFTNVVFGTEITEITISPALNSMNIVAVTYFTGIGYVVTGNLSGYVAP